MFSSLADHRVFLDPRAGNHRHQHLLLEHCIRGLADPQRFAKSGECFHWNPSISTYGNLYYFGDLSHVSQRQGCDVRRANEVRPGRPSSDGKRAGRWGRIAECAV